MYVGHVGVALALRAERDAPPLWLLVLAAQGPDWGDVLHEVLRRPFGDPGWSSHSFPIVGAGALGAALLAALVVRGPTRRGRAALLAALAYLSHWIADSITGIKPTWPGGPFVGLGLYARPFRELVLESVLVSACWWAWRRRLPSPGGGLAWALLGTLLGLQLVANVIMHYGVPVG